MNLVDGAVEGDGLDFDADLLLLELFEDEINQAALDPVAHTGISGLSVAKAFGQSEPIAAVRGNIQNGVEDLKVEEADIAAPMLQAVRNLVVLVSVISITVFIR